MASRLFFDPLVALRAAPLVSSTCSLLFAWDQHFFLGLLNRPENRPHSRPLLRSYFSSFFRRALPFVVVTIAASTWLGIGNLYARPDALVASSSLRWYAAGSALAAAHLLYVPAIAPSCRALICADGPAAGADDDVNAYLDDWLTVNARRMLTVDLAAWAAFVVAVTRSLPHSRVRE
ncbi:hypothetical protein HRG_009198 [Hirsutella rhossiliensis]|uniref:Uncharacterized protein n=1 Tax=Hirsutella rhossiliensis TaxID=111463 RepID=A0A9P8SE86_9HYPO|nr:uncharacterized protein HRG_09198 [Hirsutella rhossiliensis]KAH0959416.1 hypothetical protein HRG_09198 [Hirsutella rhossiliensis]